MHATDIVLMNYADYTKPGCVKNLIMRIDYLYKLAQAGNCVAMCIYIDLNTAITFVLTDRQKQCLTMWMDGYTQAEIGEELGITKDGVHSSIRRSSKKISAYLEK